MLRLDINKEYLQVLKTTAKVIKEGGLVLFPSDTVYILAVDPTNPLAVKKLLGFKDRWAGKAISIAVADKKMAQKYVKLSSAAENIYKNLLPGPFTIVSEGKHRVAPGIEAENGTLGIRIPDNQYIHDLVTLLDLPITATSANLSGRSPHYSVDSFLKTLSAKKSALLDLVVDAGQLPKNKPSTVIDSTESEIKILRRGDLTPSDLESLVSESEVDTQHIAKFIYSKIKPTPDKPIVFGLTGDLGAGKTVFSKSIAKLLGVSEAVTSPTFIIYNQYQLPPDSLFDQFLHFDLYRLREEQEYHDLDFLSLFKPGTIACIEWPENMGENIFKELASRANYYTVTLEYLTPKKRRLSYSLHPVKTK
jgi:L-threonylcarbamoyladenylate synthase